MGGGGEGGGEGRGGGRGGDGNGNGKGRGGEGEGEGEGITLYICWILMNEVCSVCAWLDFFSKLRDVKFQAKH